MDRVSEVTSIGAFDVTERMTDLRYGLLVVPVHGAAFPEPLRLLMRTNCASRHTQMKAYPDCNGDRVKTCPDCNGDGVVDKDTDDEFNARHAVALVLYLMTTTTKK